MKKWNFPNRDIKEMRCEYSPLKKTETGLVRETKEAWGIREQQRQDQLRLEEAACRRERYSIF